MIPEFEVVPGEWLGPLIRRRRFQLGLTQLDLAVAVGLGSKHTVRCWETGQYPVPLRRLSQLAEALHLPFELIFDGNHFSAAQCGTKAGYYKHLRERTQPCDGCRVARREWDRERDREKFGYPPRQVDWEEFAREHTTPCPVCGTPFVPFQKRYNKYYRNRPKKSCSMSCSQTLVPRRRRGGA